MTLVKRKVTKQWGKEVRKEKIKKISKEVFINICVPKMSY